MNMTNISTAGTSAVRTGSTFSAALVAGAPGRPAAGAARSTSPRLSSPTGWFSRSASAASMPAARNRRVRTSALTVPVSQLRMTSSLGLSE